MGDNRAENGAIPTIGIWEWGDKAENGALNGKGTWERGTRQKRVPLPGMEYGNGGPQAIANINKISCNNNMTKTNPDP